MKATNSNAANQAAGNSAERRTCRKTGKVRFRFRTDAVLALAERQRKGKGEQRAYECPFCSAWHLTSQPARLPGAVKSSPSADFDENVLPPS